jgi:diguanylate cyclase (GGDEF)-like protein/PAS domain S-box-containing protein
VMIALSTGVRVRPSATDELAWVLLRIARSIADQQSPELGDGIVIPAQLAGRVSAFWTDGYLQYEELLTLAHWADANFELTPALFFRRLPETLATAEFRQTGLASERPDQRAIIQARIRRLASDPVALGAYEALLTAVWAVMAPTWESTGMKTVLAMCRQWEDRLSRGVPLLELIPSDHAVPMLGLEPLVEAALARDEVVVTPIYFINSPNHGSVNDLGTVLAIGVKARQNEQTNNYHGQGEAVAQMCRVVAQPMRAAILAMLIDRPATIVEIAVELTRAPATARRHVRQLQQNGLVELVDTVTPIRYRATKNALDGVLNDLSARLQRGHGRSSTRHVHEISADASFRAIFDQAPIAMLQFDLEGHCLSCNRAAQQLFGYSNAEMSQLRGDHLVAESSDDGTFDLLEMIDGQNHREVRLRKKAGGVFWSSLTLSIVHDESGRPRFGYAMIEEVSKRRGGEDPVTALPNRALFTARLERLLAFGRRGGDSVTLLMIDLDRFKYVNDTYGHQAGDDLLREVAARLSLTQRSTDIVGRLGGDEFGIIPRGVAHREEAIGIAVKIRARLEEPFTLSDGTRVTVGASIGIAASPQDGDTFQSLMAAADRAMYLAKRTGSGYQLAGEVGAAADRAMQGAAEREPAGV